jgi:hypothetical protein
MGDLWLIMDCNAIGWMDTNIVFLVSLKSASVRLCSLLLGVQIMESVK